MHVKMSIKKIGLSLYKELSQFEFHGTTSLKFARARAMKLTHHAWSLPVLN